MSSSPTGASPLPAGRTTASGSRPSCSKTSKASRQRRRDNAQRRNSSGSSEARLRRAGYAGPIHAVLSAPADVLVTVEEAPSTTVGYGGGLEFTRRLRAVGLRGAVLGWDGQLEDDARLVTTIARTAAARGAAVHTHARVIAATGTSVKEGDVIVEFDGKEIKDSGELPIIVARTPVDKKVRMKVLREKKELTLNVGVEMIVSGIKRIALGFDVAWLHASVVSEHL